MRELGAAIAADPIGLPFCGDEGPDGHQAAHHAARGRREGATVAVEPLLCGRMHAPRGFIEGSKRSRPCGCSASAPRARSGWRCRSPPSSSTIPPPGRSSSTRAASLDRVTTRREPRPAGRHFSKPELEPGKDLPSQLRARGIDAKSIASW